MPELVITETVVYTLAELEALGWRVHEKAIENVTRWANDDGGDHCTFITQDLDYWFGETQKGIANITMSGWDYDRGYANIKGDVDLAGFMTTKKLRGKNRAMWHLVEEGGIFDSSYGFDTDKSSRNGEELATELRDELYQYSDLYDDDRPRYDKIVVQIDVVGRAIADYISEMQSEALRIITAEIEYRWSKDYAIEEAEIHEFKFTENGDIFND